MNNLKIIQVSKKLFCSIVLTILYFNFSNAQTIDLKWSQSLDKGEFGLYKGINNSLHLFNAHIPSKQVVTTFDAELKIKSQDTLSFKEDNLKNVYVNFSELFDNKIVYGISVKNKKDNTEALELLEGNLESKFLEKRKEVATFKYNKWSSIEYAESSDKSKLMVYKSIFSSKTFRNDYEYVVLDVATLNTIDQGIFSSDNKTEKVDKLVLDNLGQVHVILQKYKSKEEQKKYEMKFDYVIRIFSNSKLKKEIKVEIPNYQVLTYDYLQGEDNLYYLIGFAFSLPYDRKEKFTNKLYLSTIDCKDLEVSNFMVQELATLYPNRKLIGDEAVPYTIKSVHELNDGSFSIIGEQVLSTYNISTTVTSFSNYNIACIKLSKDFQIEYLNTIPKIQVGVNYFSFISTYFNDKIYILYNDHIENANKYNYDDLKWMSNNNSKTGLFLATVSQDGTYKKEMVLDYTNEKEKVNPILSKVISSNKILLNHVNKIGILNIK
ncbi:hypothetical protein [Flavobacterium sp.]|uniref:hypothetical protein n=1 Tax=Flavobacterium sp. TaxID=239 RepID=UPI00286D8F19|nr:hypothetical protein [Flavobacterium sp.]